MVQTSILFWLIYFIIDSVLSIIKAPILSVFFTFTTSRLSVGERNHPSSVMGKNNIEKCVESLLSQDYPNYEIIAINDEFLIRQVN